MTNPTAAMLVIGDEILSGRTQDSNTYYLAGQLTAHGINLKEVRVVSDDASAIIDSVRDLSNKYTHVFTNEEKETPADKRKKGICINTECIEMSNR